jgi:hypothetical protein
MSVGKTLALVPLVLAAASCTTVSPPYPGVVSLTVTEPRADWGPIVIARPGQSPVRLSESGVNLETVGSLRKSDVRTN